MFLWLPVSKRKNGKYEYIFSSRKRSHITAFLKKKHILRSVIPSYLSIRIKQKDTHDKKNRLFEKEGNSRNIPINSIESFYVPIPCFTEDEVLKIDKFDFDSCNVFFVAYHNNELVINSIMKPTNITDKSEPEDIQYSYCKWIKIFSRKNFEGKSVKNIKSKTKINKLTPRRTFTSTTTHREYLDNSELTYKLFYVPKCNFWVDNFILLNFAKKRGCII